MDKKLYIVLYCLETIRIWNAQVLYQEQCLYFLKHCSQAEKLRKLSHFGSNPYPIWYLEFHLIAEN